MLLGVEMCTEDKNSQFRRWKPFAIGILNKKLKVGAFVN